MRQSVKRPGAKWTLSTRGQDCDDTDKTITKQPVTWYLDNDGDGYHSEAIENCGKLGDNWKRTTKGEDCDDTKPKFTTTCCPEGSGIVDDKCTDCESLGKIPDGEGGCRFRKPCEVTSNFGYHANSSVVNACSLQKIKYIAAKLGLEKFTISSTARDAENQARIMYDNILSKGVPSQKALYGSNGDKVIDAYSTAKAKSGSTATSIKQAMEDKINELGPGNVSKHCADSSVLTVFDIRPSSIPASKKAAFVNAINQAKANGEISRFLHPGNSTDPAYHIEINVEDCELENCNK